MGNGRGSWGDLLGLPWAKHDARLHGELAALAEEGVSFELKTGLAVGYIGEVRDVRVICLQPCLSLCCASPIFKVFFWSVVCCRLGGESKNRGEWIQDG